MHTSFTHKQFQVILGEGVRHVTYATAIILFKVTISGVVIKQSDLLDLMMSYLSTIMMLLCNLGCLLLLHIPSMGTNEHNCVGGIYV